MSAFAWMIEHLYTEFCFGGGPQAYSLKPCFWCEPFCKHLVTVIEMSLKAIWDLVTSVP